MMISYLVLGVCEPANDGAKAFNIHQLDEISSIQIYGQFRFSNKFNGKMIVNQNVTSVYTFPIWNALPMIITISIILIDYCHDSP